jgi:hypothetical protein
MLSAPSGSLALRAINPVINLITPNARNTLGQHWLFALYCCLLSLALLFHLPYRLWRHLLLSFLHLT